MKNATFFVVDDKSPLCEPCGMGILREARELKGLTQEELAEKVDTTRMNIYRLEKRDGISRKWAERISPVLDVSIDALMLGKPTIGEEPETPLPGGQLAFIPQEVSFVPIRGEVAAGIWRQYDELSQDLGEPTEYAEFIAAKGYPTEQQFSLRVKGHSLNKIAPDGSMLHCVEHINGGAWDVYEDQLVIVQHSKFQGQMIEHTAKRIRRGKDGTFELWPESDHPDFQKPLKVKDFHKDDCDDEIRILAKVISIQRKP